jgi:predicted small integral membrane protein
VIRKQHSRFGTTRALRQPLNRQDRRAPQALPQITSRQAQSSATGMTIRLAKITLSLSLAAFALSVTLNNLVDYGTNFQFVQHVLSMDTTFPGNALMDRAITNHVVWSASYWQIIAAEGITGCLLLLGTIALWRARHADASVFNNSKRLVIIGCTVGFLLWFAGFMVIGGEWFAMWQSKLWNGQDNAFKFYMAILGVLIFINQPDQDPLSSETHAAPRNLT